MTSMDETKLLVLVSLPLLYRKSTFGVFQMMNIIILYSERNEKSGIVSKQEIENSFYYGSNEIYIYSRGNRWGAEQVHCKCIHRKVRFM